MVDIVPAVLRRNVIRAVRLQLGFVFVSDPTSAATVPYVVVFAPEGTGTEDAQHRCGDCDPKRPEIEKKTSKMSEKSRFRGILPVAEKNRAEHIFRRQIRRL